MKISVYIEFKAGSAFQYELAGTVIGSTLSALKMFFASRHKRNVFDYAIQEEKI